MVGPKIDVTGPFINRAGTNILEISALDDTDEAEQMVNYWADKGATSFKVYMQVLKPDLKRVVETAHKRGLKVTGHICFGLPTARLPRSASTISSMAL